MTLDDQRRPGAVRAVGVVVLRRVEEREGAPAAGGGEVDRAAAGEIAGVGGRTGGGEDFERTGCAAGGEGESDELGGTVGGGAEEEDGVTTGCAGLLAGIRCGGPHPGP